MIYVGLRKRFGQSGDKELQFPWVKDENELILGWQNTAAAEKWARLAKYEDYIMRLFPKHILMSRYQFNN